MVATTRLGLGVTCLFVLMTVFVGVSGTNALFTDTERVSGTVAVNDAVGNPVIVVTVEPTQPSQPASPADRTPGNESNSSVPEPTTTAIETPVQPDGFNASEEDGTGVDIETETEETESETEPESESETEETESETEPESESETEPESESETEPESELANSD